MRILVGNPQRVSDAPARVFDDSRTAFLAALSKALLAHGQVRDLPDVVAFAYWCRRANLARLAERHRGDGNGLRLGLGLSFHICPSNVPVNFAYSLAFGLLSGNSCVLRLPSRESDSATVIVETIAALLARPEHAALADAIVLSRFERNDAINAYWLGQADARIVWGGDATVEHMRAFPGKPRAREVAFADRYSLCVLDPEAVVALDTASLQALCGRLYNDIYLMDQAACSSPQLVAWIGDAQRAAQAGQLLWPALAAHAGQRYAPAPAQAMDKFVEACQIAIHEPQARQILRHGNLLYRVELDALAAQQDQRRGHYGTVHEITLPALDALLPVINERYQTLTYFGIDADELRVFVGHHAPRGIDRIVPVGQALDMDLIWDGYDIAATLSRLVAVH